MNVNVVPLWLFMQARYRIFCLRREGVPPPWTLDPVLARYHFCNVFREDDAVTGWVRDHIREPQAAHPHLWFLLVAARFFNEPRTLHQLLMYGRGMPWGDRPFAPDEMVESLGALSGRGVRLFRPAYMVRCDAGMTKHEYVVRRVLAPMWDERERLTALIRGQATLRGAVAALTPCYGRAGVLAYEVGTDRRHTAWLHNAPDINTYAHIGPGAKRGLNRLLGREPSARLSQAEALQLAVALRPELQSVWPAGWPVLELRDVEGAFCEFDKYERARTGRHGLRHYRPPTPIDTSLDIWEGTQ